MKVPLLGDIPLFGGLFRSEKESRIRRELIIDLTPHVVTSNDSNDLIDRTRDLIDDLPLAPEFIEQMQSGSLKPSSGGFGPAFEPITDESDATDTD